MAWYYYAAAAAVKLASEVQQGNSQAASYGAQKDQAKANSRMALQQGNAAEEIQRRQIAVELGKQRAAGAQSGFDSSSSSMASLQSQNAAEMELDVLTKRYEARLRSINYDNEASRLKASESSARVSGWLGGASGAMGIMGGYGG